MTTTTPALHTKAVLIKLTIKGWSAKKTDKQLSGELATNHNANSKALNVQKDLIEKDRIKPITKLDGQIRAWLKERVLPWSDSGYDILPATHIQEVCDFLDDAISERQKLVDQLIADYEKLVANAKLAATGLGTAFKASDYPTERDLRQKYSISYDIEEVPTGDWRVNISNAERERISKRHEESAKKRFTDLVHERNTRALEIIERFGERLELYDPEEPGKHPLHATAVTDVQDFFLDLIEAFNFEGDPRVKAIQQKALKSLAPILNADTLKKDAKARQTAINVAGVIRDDVAALFRND